MSTPVAAPDPLDAVPSERAAPLALLRTIWRRKWIVLGVVVLTTAIAVVLAERQPDEYQGTASLLFRNPDFASALGGQDVFSAGADPQRDAQTNVDVVSSRAVADVARARLRTRETSESLLASVSVTPDENSDLATITATRSSPEDAARVANAFADAYIAYRASTDRAAIERARQQLQERLAASPSDQDAAIEANIRQLELLETVQTGDAEVVARAEADPSPTAPHPRRDGILGLVVGLIVGCGLALLVDFLDRRLRDQEELEEAYPDYTLIGALPDDRAAARAVPASGAMAEAYRVTREGLRFLDPDNDLRCILITSSEEGEGKSTVARNLAASLAEGGQRTVLVEADLRRPTMTTTLGLERGEPGLSDMLVTRDATRIRVQRSPLLEGLPISILPSGTVPPNPADLLRGARLPKVLDRLVGLFDVVVIDAPPVEPIADTRVLLQLDAVDAVVFVGRVGVTRRDHARQARKVIQQSGHRVVGLVVIAPPDRSQSGYYG